MFNVTTSNGDQGGNEVPDTRTAYVDNFTLDSYTTQFELWVSSGFIQLQTLIDNMILQNLTQSSSAYILPTVQNVRIAAYDKDDAATVLSG